MNKKLINNLKELKNISPSSEWKDDLGSRLESMAMATFSAYAKASADRPALAGFLVSMKTYFRFHHLVRATVVVSIVLTLGLGSSIFTVNAAKDSLPGDFLYNVKITKEKVHAAITLQPEAKVKLKLAFAGNRLKEAGQLADKMDNKDGEAISRVMNDFQKEIEEAEKHLTELKQASVEKPGTKEKVDRTNEEISSQTEKYEIVLSRIKEKPFLEEDVVSKVDTALISSRKLAEAVKVEETNEEPVENVDSESDLIASPIESSEEIIPTEGVETEPTQTASQIEAGEEIIVVGPASAENEPIIVVGDDEVIETEELTDVATCEAESEAETEEVTTTPVQPTQPVQPAQDIEASEPAQNPSGIEAGRDVNPDFQGGIKKEAIEFEGLMKKE